VGNSVSSILGPSSRRVDGGSVCNNPDVSEVEVEVADEAEPPSSQHHTPSRSRAAVLLIKAGAKVDDKFPRLRKLAQDEGIEELRALVLQLHMGYFR
jgi:hypothetical protein